MNGILFKSVSHDRNVVLNFLGRPADEFDFYASAFHRAGKNLAESAISVYQQGHRLNDLDAVPIVYLYRHSLELYLKGMIRLGRDILNLQLEGIDESLNGKIKSRLRRHNFLELTDCFESIYKKMDIGFNPWGLTNEYFQTYEDFKSFIQEWNQIDEGSFSMRYPTDQNDEANLSHHFSFHLPTFCQRMDEVLNSLDGCTDALRNWRAEIKEMKDLQCCIQENSLGEDYLRAEYDSWEKFSIPDGFL